MRIINNDDSKQPSSALVIDPFLIVFDTVVSSLALSTGILAPFAVLLNQFTLPPTQSRIVTLVATVLSMVWLGTPMEIALVGFIFGSFVSEGVSQSRSFWWHFLLSLGVYLGLGAGLVAWKAKSLAGSLQQIWSGFIQDSIASMKTLFDAKVPIEWEELTRVLVREGAFFYLAVGIFSLWLSIGLAAHFGLLEKSESYSPKQLRQILVPPQVKVAFLLTFGALIVWGNQVAFLGGPLRVLMAVMLIPGTISLSCIMERMQIQKSLRSLIYFICFSLFIPLLVLSVLYPNALERIGVKRQKGFRLPFESEEKP